ncbi:g9546 [Coccomyxa elongata]
MVKEDTINMDVPCTVADFCELFKRADTVVGCHRETYNNDNIRVSAWDGPNRRVAFLAPYQAPGWVKKTIGYEVVKVVEQQHLEVVEEEGTLKSMTMTSSPSLYVPGMGNVSIGNVCFHVSAAENDEEACKVCTKLRCSAEQFKWLWAIRSIVEKIMLRECRTVAERFVEYCKRVVKERADHMRAEALKDMKPLNILSLPSGVDGSLSARSTDGGEASPGPASARGGGGGGVTARSLSRLSIASCNSIYYDASEDLEEPPLSSRWQSPEASPSYKLGGIGERSAISMMVNAGVQTSHRRFESLDELFFQGKDPLTGRSNAAQKPPKSRARGVRVATEEQDVLLWNPRTLHDTLTALQQQLQKVEGDINILLAAVEQNDQSRRSLGSRSSSTDWKLLLAGAAAGASMCCTALWLTWRLRSMR